MPKPTNPLRIAVLEADHPLENTALKYGTYGGVFASLITNAATSLGWDPATDLDISKWDVERHQLFPPSLDSIDGIIISGSRANAFDDTPWIVKLVEYTRQALANGRIRVFGVCFGHQIVARALGCRVDRGEKGWEASVMPVMLSSRGSELFAGKETMSIFQMHRDVVLSLPEGAENLGSSKKCEIQGMYLPGRFITIQGHPEFTEEIVRELLEARRNQGIFTEDEFQDMIGRVGDSHDGVLIAKAFLNFLEEQ